MRGDVPGAGCGRAFEPGLPAVGTGECLDAEGHDLHAGIGVDADDIGELARRVKVRVNAAELDFVEADSADFFCDDGIVGKAAEAVALDAEVFFDVVHMANQESARIEARRLTAGKESISPHVHLTGSRRAEGKIASHVAAWSGGKSEGMTMRAWRSQGTKR